MMDPHLSEECRRAVALSEKATPGPMFVETGSHKAWVTVEPYGNHARKGKLPPGDCRTEEDITIAEFERGPGDRHEDDAALYAHASEFYAPIARAALALEAECERLRARAETWESVVRWITKVPHNRKNRRDLFRLPPDVVEGGKCFALVQWSGPINGKRFEMADDGTGLPILTNEAREALRS